MTRIAFLGTGLLGSAFVEAAVKRGDQVTVWNRTADKAQALYDAVKGDLARMANRVEYFGERADLAAVYKLCGNAFIIGINALVADVLTVAAGAGAAPADALRVV